MFLNAVAGWKGGVGGDVVVLSTRGVWECVCFGFDCEREKAKRRAPIILWGRIMEVVLKKGGERKRK